MEENGWTGDIIYELQEAESISETQEEGDGLTYSLVCGALLTIICC